jgi:biopolymer transport protein ExbD
MRIGDPAPIRQSIPLTPLVDIVFLLLMFFMLSTTFTKFSAIDLSRGASSAGSSTRAETAFKRFPGVIITVTDTDSILLNGSKLPIDRLARELDRFHEMGLTRVAVKAGGKATVQDLVAVLDAIRQSRLNDVTVVR